MVHRDTNVNVVCNSEHDSLNTASNQPFLACTQTICSKRVNAVVAGPVAKSVTESISTPSGVAVKYLLNLLGKSRNNLLVAAVLLSTGTAVSAQEPPTQINLSELFGVKGFVMNGTNSGAWSGYSVSNAGDINNDGIDDVIVGHPIANPGGKARAGQSFVVFGGAGMGGLLELSAINGFNGFVINGADRDSLSGVSVSAAGDVNGDGIGDLIIGANLASPNGKNHAGESYVVFGSEVVGSSGSVELAELDGSDGFVINGADENDWSGIQVSGAGDVNGDGFDDVIIGAVFADPENIRDAGESYVVFGGAMVGSEGVFELAELDGPNGFAIKGKDVSDKAGQSVSGAGDINGDGFADVIIGAPDANPDDTDASSDFAGESYVVFGRNGGYGGSLRLSNLNGTNGFLIEGLNRDDGFGDSVSGAGDINGDGMADLFINADRANKSYVIFGNSSLGGSGTFDLTNLEGSNGFVITGISGRMPRAVSDAGDVNGDGMDDLIISAFVMSANSRRGVTETYVLFGRDELGRSGEVALSNLDSSTGFVINGIDTQNNERSGEAVSGAGDFNGDGLADVIIGAPNAIPITGPNAGERDVGQSYLVYGMSSTQEPPSGPVLDNDFFVQARNLEGVDEAVSSGTTVSFLGTMSRATAQDEEPSHSGKLSGPLQGPRNSIWFRWNPSENYLVEIDTVGSSTGTVLAVYTGDLGVLNKVGMGIDNDGGAARVRFATSIGTTYFIAVDGYGADSQGDIRLNMRQPTMDPTECTITGTDGPDMLVGTNGPDVICGLDGNDTIKSLGGADVVFGGGGFDFLSGGGGNDILLGEDGNDALGGGSGKDLLSGGAMSDRLFGGKGADRVFGGRGADRLYGGPGNDRLFGEQGSDRLYGGEDNDYLNGGPFIDFCRDIKGFNNLLNCE